MTGWFALEVVLVAVFAGAAQGVGAATLMLDATGLPLEMLCAAVFASIAALGPAAPAAHFAAVAVGFVAAFAITWTRGFAHSVAEKPPPGESGT